MTSDDTLPVTVAARSAADLLWLVVVALVLGPAVACWAILSAGAAELTNCEKATAYFMAAQCAQPWVSCDKDGNIHTPCAGRDFCTLAPMQSVVADSMRQNSERLRARALAYQMLCNAEKSKP